MTEKPQLDTIFGRAIEIERSDARDAYVQCACGDDTGLREHVQQLVRDHFRAGDFLEQPIAQLDPADICTPDRFLGERIGPYVIREQIGEGGMGVVYAAEQQQPLRRQVALKIVRPGMASKEVVARFEAERQALAIMDHPHIAKVLDGGMTEAGQPYFVMELVQGARVTEYCDQQRLDTGARLELFQQICGAIHHAHQKGIIHRDLKPSNLLVPEIDGAAVPKVIDFGIAKAVDYKLTDRTIFTQFSQMIGTPLYMSPEQVGGAVDVDTRSDVYSLGVVLYELLTGRTPFDGDTLRQADELELRRIIREDHPRRPSAALSTLHGEALSKIATDRRCNPLQLASSLQGELDWIVMKAIDKDRDRRYESASALAEDVHRFLRNEPVVARPPSTRYRMRKFTQRNRSAVVACAFIFLTACLGLGAATISYRAVRDEAYKSTQLLDLIRDIFASGGYSHGMRSANRTLAEAIDVVAASVDTRFRNNPELKIEAHKIIGGAYFSYDQRDKALEQYHEALRLAEREHGKYDLEVADICTQIAYVHWETYGRVQLLGEAYRYSRRALEIHRRHGIENGQTAHIMFLVGSSIDDPDRGEEAVALVERAKELRLRFMRADDHGRIWAYWDLGLRIARIYDTRNDEVNRLMAKTVEIGMEQVQANPGTAAGALRAQARCFRWQGDLDRALASFSQAEQIFRDAGLEREPRALQNLFQIAELYHAQHRHTEAEIKLKQLRAIADKHGLIDWSVQCDFLEAWGEFLREDYKTAAATLRTVAEQGLNHLTDDHIVVPFTHYYRARSLEELGRPNEVREVYEQFRQWQKPLLTVLPKDELLRLGYSLSLLGIDPEANADEALHQHLLPALEWNEKWPFYRRLPHLYLVKADAEHAQGKLKRAIESLEAALQKQFPATTALEGPKTKRELELALADYLVEDGRLGEAKSVLADAVKVRQNDLPEKPTDADLLPVALAQLRYGTFLLDHQVNDEDLQEATRQLQQAHDVLKDNLEAAKVTVQRATEGLERCGALSR